MVLKRQMDVLANNLANVTTPGFKGESMLFVEHLKRTDHSERLRFVQDTRANATRAPGALPWMRTVRSSPPRASPC
jgi:flagellar basal-body rod protein FlgF